MKPKADTSDEPTPHDALQDAYRRMRKLELALEDERANSAALSAQRDALLHSRSWRLTAPLRWVTSRLQPKKGAEDESSSDLGAPPLRPGLAGVPADLLLPQNSGIESENATCRLLNVEPMLEGSIDELAYASLAAASTEAVPEYLGWRSAPPTIAFIGGTELQTELAFEAKVLALREDNWRAILAGAGPSLLLIETVWHVDHRQWRYAMVRDGSNEALLELLQHCRQNALPVALWYRETPGNLAQFAWLAEHVDVVCVADPEAFAELAGASPPGKVHYLPPAIQPALHNPVRSNLVTAAGALSRRVVFDGWWDLHKGRLPELPQLGALRSQGLLIAESHWDFSRVRLADAPDFREHIIGCLSPRAKLALSRLQGAEVFAAKPLAGAWRSAQAMIRAAACGSLVARLDGQPPWIEELEVPGIGGSACPGPALQELLTDGLAGSRHRHLAWRALMNDHTVAHRLQTIGGLLSIDDVDFLPAGDRIACLLATMRPDRLERCIAQFREDLYPGKELIVVLHGDGDLTRLGRSLVREGEPIRIFQMGANCSLGACINYAGSQTDAPYWTKMDDDDVYGRHYLSDVMRYQRTGNHRVFGKPPMFNYLESVDELLWDPEWASLANRVHVAARSRAALVAGGTIGGRTKVLETLQFSERRRGGSDSDFVMRCYEEGLDVLSMDGFNFVRYRSKQPGFHTWNMEEGEARSRSRNAGNFNGIKIALP